MLHPLSGLGYQFWSGIGSDFGQVTLITGVVLLLAGLYHQHNCHVDGCHWLGKHRMAGGKYVICGRCLRKGGGVPDTITAEHVHSEHQAYTA